VLFRSLSWNVGEEQQSACRQRERRAGRPAEAVFNRPFAYATGMNR